MCGVSALMSAAASVCLPSSTVSSATSLQVGLRALSFLGGNAVSSSDQSLAALAKPPIFILYLLPPALLVSNEGQHPNAAGSAVLLLSTGPMCRYSSDLMPMLRILADESGYTFIYNIIYCYIESRMGGTVGK